MSIINQVLKDLDQQRGPADGLQIAALQGIGLVQSRNFQWPRALTTGVSGLTLVLAGFILFQYFGNRTVDLDRTETVPVENTTPVTMHNTQPETLEIDPVVVAAPVEPSPEQPVVEESRNVVTNESPAITKIELPSPKPIKTLSARQRAEHAFAAGQKAMRKHDKSRAEQLFNSALDHQPQHTDARIQLAAIFIERSNTNAAERILEDGLSLDPAQAQLARLYAQLLSSRGEYELALLSLSPVTDTTTPDAESLALRGAIYARLDKHEDAVSDYRMALKLNPEQANWWMGLGLSLEHQDLYGGAAAAYKNAGTLPLAPNVKAFVQQRLQQLQNTAGDD
jgi:MSHA biogenesis protein MshN